MSRDVSRHQYAIAHGLCTAPNSKPKRLVRAHAIEGQAPVCGSAETAWVRKASAKGGGIKLSQRAAWTSAGAKDPGVLKATNGSRRTG